ncbi:hypothetical protein [Halobacillus massiliensis]|uniref:hypothetical protein n=1 Tax=Halobacillus massiliensis TaxID=1926286 RepID=UPI0009E27819|nr:hypothetical protein [Halobacillus massiliensis]
MKQNRIVSLLFIFGAIVIAVGIVAGIYFGTSEYFIELESLQEIIGLMIFINCLGIGIFFFGFSEVIQLLQGIFNQQYVKDACSNLGIRRERKQRK